MYMHPFSTKQRPISFRQLRAVELWLKNGRKSRARALREAGYSPAICKQPHKVFSSPAVREEFNKRGLGYDGLRDNLTPIIKPTCVFKEYVTLPDIPREVLVKLKEQLGDIGYISQVH